MGPCIVSPRGGIPRVIKVPCIVSPRGGIPRVIEGPCMKLKGSYRVWLALALKGISPGNHPFGIKSNFTGKLYSLGSILAWVILCIGSPIRGCFKRFSWSLSLYNAQEKAKLNEEFF